jgi:lysine 2,3-aminomutase
MTKREIRNLDELGVYLQSIGTTLEECGLAYLAGIPNLPLSLKIPYFYAKLINWLDPEHPLRKMVVPEPEEAIVEAYELADPIGDGEREVVPGLIHRYKDRVLLLLTMYCLIHCRFCFRSEVVGKKRDKDLGEIEEYLRQHLEVAEIIFSGGDPFTFELGFLQKLVELLAPLEHIKRWRWHTRVPATDPEAISEEFLEVLFGLQAENIQQVVVIHINHPRELTPETIQVIKKLREKGIVVLTQTVLLKGVNDNKETLRELFVGLVDSGAKPYYLHHLDQAKGTHHFRLSIQEGVELYRSLRGPIPGYALPEYVVDIPGMGKVPVRDLEHVGNGWYLAHTANGDAWYQDPAYLGGESGEA